MRLTPNISVKPLYIQFLLVYKRSKYNPGTLLHIKPHQVLRHNSFIDLQEFFGIGFLQVKLQAHANRCVQAGKQSNKQSNKQKNMFHLW